MSLGVNAISLAERFGEPFLGPIEGPREQGLTGRVFQLWVGSGLGIGKNYRVGSGLGSGSGIGIIY